jgi:succinate dehydrogenase / fumarate reductase, membrane anchor subunit
MATVEQAYIQHFQPDRPPSRREVWSWFAIRISGLLLVFLVLGHMAIMHVINGGVGRVNFSFVAARWTGFLWRSYDWMMLALTLLHATLGARTVIQDHLKPPRLKLLARSALYLVTTVALLGGTAIIAVFQPPGL